jgi:hypothetical protein
MEEKYNFYGCYQGDYRYFYKWQCKLFNNQIDATEFTTNSDSNITLLLPIDKRIPAIAHKVILKNKINKIINVDIKQ